ncbi:MAG: hypothetical protein ACYSWZ_17320 [Planctomycetota bacterium]|jgi:hypothetical protein
MRDHDDFIETCTFSRRNFLATIGTTYGALAFPWLKVGAVESRQRTPRKRKGATVRAVFLYPGRQKKYMTALREIEDRLGMKIITEDRSVANDGDARKVIKEIETTRPDGLLLIMFYNRSLGHADLLLEEAQKLNIPTVFFIGLGVKHGPITKYRRHNHSTTSKP